MSNTIIIKNKSTTGAPVPGDLEQGELAINLLDETLHSKNSSDAIFEIGGAGAAQTPWSSNIDGAGFSLTDVSNVDIYGDITVADPPAAEQVTASLNLYDSDGTTIIGSFGHQGNATPALEIRNYFPTGSDGSINMYVDKAYVDAGDFSHRFSNSYMRIQSVVTPTGTPAAGDMDIVTFDMSNRDGDIQTRIQNNASSTEWLFQNNVQDSNLKITLHNSGGDVNALDIDPTTGTLLADFGTFSVDAADFNGVALTTGGAATNYLSADGTYTAPSGAAQTPWAQDIDGAGFALDEAEFTDYGITHQTPTVTGNAVTVDCTLGNTAWIDLDPATAAVTLTLSNPPPSGTYGEVLLYIQMGTPAYDITWPGSVTWQDGGSAPVLTSTDNVVDLVHLSTVDGGTTWYGTWTTAAQGVITLNDLEDVVSTSPTTGDLLRYNGSSFVEYADSNFATSGHAHAMDDLSDVNITSIGDDDILIYDSGTGMFRNYSLSGDIDLNDVGVTTAQVAIITGKTALTSGLVSTDELLINNGGVLNRMDISVIEAYMQANLTGFGTVNGSGTDNYIAVWNGTGDIDAVGSFNIANAVDKTGTETISGAWEWQDNISIRFGNSADAIMYYDGVDDFRIDLLDTNNFRVRGGTSGTEAMFHALANGEFGAYYNGNLKLTTTNTGINVTGIAVTDGVDMADSDELRFGTGNDVVFDFNATNFITVGTGQWQISGFTSIAAGAVDADFDAITATSYGGILEANLVDKSVVETITGLWTFQGGIDLDDNDNLRFGTGNDIVFDFNATNFITVGTGQWQISGFTSIAAGAVDADFDAITATSYGGILEANLVDKTATETITGIRIQSSNYFRLNDNVELYFGSSNDALMAFNGTNLILQSAVGSFDLQFTDIDINMQDNDIIRPVLVDYAIESNTQNISGTTATLTYSNGPAFQCDMEAATGNCTITLSGGPPSGTYGQITVEVTQDTTVRTLAWAGGTFRWAGGTVHPVTTDANGYTLYTFETWNGGTTWYAAGADYG